MMGDEAHEVVARRAPSQQSVAHHWQRVEEGRIVQIEEVRVAQLELAGLDGDQLDAEARAVELPAQLVRRADLRATCMLPVLDVGNLHARHVKPSPDKGSQHGRGRLHPAKYYDG